MCHLLSLFRNSLAYSHGGSCSWVHLDLHLSPKVSNSIFSQVFFLTPWISFGVIVVLYVFCSAMASLLLLLLSRPPTERLFILIGSMPYLRRLLPWSALVLGILSPYRLKWLQLLASGSTRSWLDLMAHLSFIRLILWRVAFNRSTVMIMMELLLLLPMWPLSRLFLQLLLSDRGPSSSLMSRMSFLTENWVRRFTCRFLRGRGILSKLVWFAIYVAPFMASNRLSTSPLCCHWC